MVQTTALDDRAYFNGEMTAVVKDAQIIESSVRTL
jgi:hypothetical protein